MAGWWRRWLGRRRGEQLETLRRRYERFRHLIEGNNRVLELIADAGDKLGGDYLFDRRYLNELVDELDQSVEGVVYDLNAMTDGRYIDLVETFDHIRHNVRSALSPAAFTPSELVIPFEEIDMDSAGAVGEKMACLGELRTKLGLSVPDGLVVSASACRRQFRARGLDKLIAEQAEKLQRVGSEEITGVASRLQKAVLEAPLQRDVARAIRRALKQPKRAGWRYAIRSSALGEDGEHSFAGQHATRLNVAAADAEDAYREVLSSLFSPEALRYRLDKGIQVSDALMAVGFLAMVPARASGVLHTVDPAAPQNDIMVVSAAYGLGPTVVEGSASTDRFELSRDPTPKVVKRTIAAKEQALVASDEGGIAPVGVQPSDRDVACISDETLIELGRAALRIERHAGHHQEIEWAVDQKGRIAILQARVLRVEPYRIREDEDLARILAEHPVLLRGKGTIACRGVGAGPVVAVRSAADMRDFPYGGVLLAQSPSPRYSPLLSRASAVITNVGSSTGHLAAVAREFRVPMLVDVGAATQMLEPGAEVTVDAEENVIYEGLVRELLRHHLSNQRSDDEFEEFRRLRRLLRRIAPLNLTNPDADVFRARSCTTYHDVIRFAHEMSVRALVELPGLTARDRKQFIKRLTLEIPMDLDILDIGGGITSGSKDAFVGRDRVCSTPLVALLQGLCAPGAWHTEPVDLDMESFLTSATRATSFTALDASPVRPNLAVISEDYLNLNLLLGYHFNLVDCRLADGPTNNYIYFRFTGGVTDITRRSRRARVIAAILQEYEFGVETKGDLVVGRLRNIESEPMRDRLEMIGRLIGFTRQLDVLMRDEEAVRERTREFVGHEPVYFDGLLVSENAEEM